MVESTANSPAEFHKSTTLFRSYSGSFIFVTDYLPNLEVIPVYQNYMRSLYFAPIATPPAKRLIPSPNFLNILYYKMKTRNCQICLLMY